MFKLKRFFLVALFALLPIAGQADVIIKKSHDYDYAVFQTNRGDFTIRLESELAPVHVNTLKSLIDRGFYDGLYFHRVLNNLVQTGDPALVGRMPERFRLPLEASHGMSYERGTVAMARFPHDPNSASTQFFVLKQGAPYMDGQYTVLGKVTQGMGTVDNLKKADKILRAFIINR